MSNINCIGITDPGLIRSNNEDAFLIREDLGFAALADGMGGEAAGELASEFLVTAALEEFSRGAGKRSENISGLLHAVFELANARILDHATKKPDHRGMGCTAEVLAFDNGRFALAHVGDSRTYLFRNRTLQQMTRDHSFVQQLVDRGQLTSEEAFSHPMRHVILNAVGQGGALQVETIDGDIIPGDLLLLCSDGLTDMVRDDAIRHILSLPLELASKAQNLIDAARDAGGHDNVTVVLCEFL